MGWTWEFPLYCRQGRPWILEEPHTVELPDGRLANHSPTRKGRTSAGRATADAGRRRGGFRHGTFAPFNGARATARSFASHGSYAPDTAGWPRHFSADGGQTWIAPAKDHGFLVDGDAYGYGAGALLPYGSAHLIYQKTGSHRIEDAKANSLLS